MLSLDTPKQILGALLIAGALLTAVGLSVGYAVSLRSDVAALKEWKAVHDMQAEEYKKVITQNVEFAQGQARLMATLLDNQNTMLDKMEDVQIRIARLEGRIGGSNGRTK